MTGALIAVGLVLCIATAVSGIAAAIVLDRASRSPWGWHR